MIHPMVMQVVLTMLDGRTERRVLAECWVSESMVGRAGRQ